MKQTCPTLPSGSRFHRFSIHLVVLFCLLTGAERVKGQCFCQIDFSTPEPEEVVAPDNYNFHSNVPVYNAEGQIVSYSFEFQFKCLGLPICLNPTLPFYTYHILYRPAGSNDPWTVGTATISSTDFFVGAGGMLPGVEYEFTVTCPCPCGTWEDLFDPECTSQMHLDDFLDNGVSLNNVQTPWTRIYCPPTGSWITNMQVENIDFAGGTAHIFWEYGVVPPRGAILEYRQKTTPESAWIPLVATLASEFTLSGLTACAEYEVRLTLPTDCGTDPTKTMSFTFSDCSAVITDVYDITGTRATVEWAPNSLNIPNDYTLTWKLGLLNPNSVTVPGPTHTLTNLLVNKPYTVQVIPNCGPSAQCPDASQEWTFKTTCDGLEFNNSFGAAFSIPFGEPQSASLNPVDDVDYFRFVPDCERIQIDINHPLLTPPGPVYIGSSFGSDNFANLPYQVFDENLVEIPSTPYLLSDNPQFWTYYHAVHPGETYFLKIGPHPNPSFWSPYYQNVCYSFNARECIKCFDNSGSGILGDDMLSFIPATETYELTPPFVDADVNWSITGGPAVIIPTGDPNIVQVHFSQTGTYTLSASIIRCDGAVMTYSKTITVTNNCPVNGWVTSNLGGLQPLQANNSLFSNNYQVVLNLPQGTPYNWTLTSGQAMSTINGNVISIKQTSANATFLFYLLQGECVGEPHHFNFSIVGAAAPESGSDKAFSVSPNPVSDALFINADRAPDSPEVFTAELFDAYSKIVRSATGQSGETMQVNCRDLPVGQYYLRIAQGARVQTFKVTKI